MTSIEQSNLFFYVLPILAVQIAYVYVFGFHKDLRVRQLSIALLGVYWCVAALKVEWALEETYPHFDYHNPPADMSKYTPFCDFASWAKCSKVLMSPYGRVMRYVGIAEAGSALDVPNPVLGFGFFLAHILYPLLKSIKFPALDELASMVCVFVGFFSIWLAHKLFIVLEDFCIVCVSSYMANFLLLHTMLKIRTANNRCAGKLARA